jgi:hypothetical protein
VKLEAVITCVDYADFLSVTLPVNKSLFDRLVIVTTPKDKVTQRLCEYWYVECVVTDAFNTDAGEFCKGRAINAGLERLDLDGWALHLDADIALPPETRRVLDMLDLDPAMVYGIDRHNIVGASKWAEQVMFPRLQHEAGSYIHTEAYPVATRFMSPPDGGYLPIGFFQLWNAPGSDVLRYPEQHADAGRTDMLFAAQWPRPRRGLIPELIAYHLESERAAQGANWSGRVTRPFTVGPPPKRSVRSTVKRLLRGKRPYSP